MGGDAGSYTGSTDRGADKAEDLFDSAVDEVRDAGVRNVFISFHIEDEDQVRLLRHQARDNQFGVHFRDYSVKEPFDEKWKSQCRERIEQTSALICMVGEDTWKRKAVEWEIREAHRQNKMIIGVRIHRDKDHRIPQALLDANAQITEWNLAKLSKQLEK